MSAAEGRSLCALLGVNFVNFGGLVQVRHLSEEEWASVTFAGARHTLRIVLKGDGAAGAGRDFLEALSELELPIPGGIVADVALLAEARSDDGRYVEIELEALTIAGA